MPEIQVCFAIQELTAHKVDSANRWINLYAVDNTIGLAYPCRPLDYSFTWPQ